ncbi:hypothetical protein ACSQ67_023732 [Phaseolus vulgaris]
MGNNGLFRYADGVDKLLMFFGTLGSLGDGLQTPLMFYILSEVINAFGDKNSHLTKHDVNMYALRLFCAALGVGLSAFIEGICWTRTAERQASRMRMEYLKSVLRQEVGFFDTQTGGTSTTYQVVSLISSDANTIQVVLCEKIPDCLAYMSTFLFCHIFAFVLSWRLTLAAIPLSLMFIVPALVFGKIMLDLAMKMIESYGVAGGIAEQAISSIRTVYSYVGENQTLNRFSSALQKTLEFGIKQGFAKGLMLGSMGVIYISWGFQAWVGTILITKVGEQGGHVFVAGFNVLMGGLSILSALPNLTAITEATAAVTRLLEMIDRVPTIDSEDKKGKALSYVRGRLNSKTSTFVTHLDQTHQSCKDSISLFQQARRLQLKWLRSQFGLVNQEPVLFATSIKENILFGKEGASMESVITAAKTANAHDFIVKLPDGYETQVGQFGFQLSGGQKQRVAIARALLRDPKVLLLDEATSALDAQSERVVQAAIDQASKGRTTIIIAHRLSTIQSAHLIAVLQAGRVIETGTHNELMELTDGEYAHMVELQQVTTQTDEFKPSNLQIEGKNFHRMSTPQSPAVSFRSSTVGTPMLYPFSQGFSMGTPYSYSIQYDPDDDSYEDNMKRANHPAPSQWRLLKMNAPELGRAMLGILGAIGSGAVQPVNAYCVGKLISVYFETDSSKMKSKAKDLALIFLGIGVFNFFTSILQHYNFAVMGERLTKRIREKMLEKLMTFEIGWFDDEENTSASICARLSSEANLVRSLVGDRLSLLAQAVFGSVFAYTLGLVLTWRLSLVMIAVQPLVIGSFYSRSVLMKSMAEKARKAQREGSQLASEAVINHRTITAFSSQKRMLALFKSTMVGPKRRVLGSHGFQALVFLAPSFSTLHQQHWLIDAGSMTSDLSKGSSAVGSVFAVLERKTEIDPQTSWGGEKKRKIRGRIELKNIFFAYPTRPDQMIFKGLCLKVESGKTVALVGHSGCGKSTVIGLIERFYDPAKGTVCIDEQDIKSYNLRMLRSQIALVSQEPALFSGTIRENIAYGKENTTESEIIRAASLANAHEFISGMNEGYETYCGERGVQLSGGQKQRIALARSILKNPAILLLDEATSALDSVSEILVQEALEKIMVGRTCIAVAHRLSTIQKSNYIAVIKNGKVVEQGSHNELISLGRDGAYNSLVKLQIGSSPR